MVEAGIGLMPEKRRPQPILPSPMITETRDGGRFDWLRRSKRASQPDDEDGWRDYDHGFRDGYQAARRENLAQAEAEIGRLRPIVEHIAGMVAPEAGFEYGQIPHQLIYDARAALNSAGK
jgi:hypothetical protein